MPAIKLIIITIADVQHLALQQFREKIVVGWLIKQSKSPSATTITIAIVRGWRGLADDHS